MATITFCGESYTVDHAVQGADYVHGYDASGVCVVSFEAVEDMSLITYDGEYMAPEDCVTEPCNKVIYCGGQLQTLGGDNVSMPRSNLAEDALYSPLSGTATSVGTRAITSADVGKTLLFSWTSGEGSVDTEFTLSLTDSTSIPLGAEIALYYMHGQSCQIKFTGGIYVDIAGEGRATNRTVKIAEKYGMVAIKKMLTSNGSDYWLVTGPVEVV